MPTVNHTITVTINGTDRSSLLLKDSLYIRSSIGNKGDTASFTIRDSSGSFAPLDWDTVRIAVNGTNVFGGYITTRQASGFGSGSTKVAHWAVECRDWSILLDTVIVQYGYVDTADSDVVDGLFDIFLPGEGFDSTTHVDTVNNDIDIGFENITLRDALNMLADIAGAEWHIAPDQSVYWYSPSAPGNAAFNIDVVAPNDSTTFDVLTGSLRYGSDASTIVNRVRVMGGEEQTGTATETFAANGTKSVFGPLAQKPGSVWKVTFYVSGILNTRFASQIGYEPGDSLSIDGGDFNTLVNLESRYVKIQKTDGSVPDNATNVTVTYYTLTPVNVVVNDETSQDVYGRIFEQTVYDETLTSSDLAQEYGDRVIAEYAYGRTTIRFDVTEHGLLPGRLITVNAPVLSTSSSNNDALAIESPLDVLLLEDGTSRLMLENYGEARKYLIQDISLRTVVTGSNVFMVVASVSCGKYIPTLLDSLSGLSQFSGGGGRLPAQRNIGRLTRLGNDLGEVVAGRATFTDGGTAPFTWDNYADHTGAVIGLEDNGANAYGVLYILDDGTVKAKVGRMDGLSAVGGVTPSGWGIWTNNGYFSGVIAASQMIGGTIATSAPPINSSNPGVYMTSAGLFAYGTLGLTFSLPSDPVLRPFFSSGTITNTIYEVTTASVLRTGTAGARVQMDNSGIFAYNSGGTLKFSVDATTGRLTASDGIFSGSVSASTITGGTITGGFITGGTISAAQLTGGTVTGGLVSGGTVSGALFTLNSGTITVSSSGIKLIAPTSYVEGDPSAVQWMAGSNVIGEITTLNSGNDNLFIKAGKASSRQGRIVTTVHHTTSAYSEFKQQYDGFEFWAGGAVKFYVNAGTAFVYTPVMPTASSDNLTLGDATRAFKYLYLYDGTDEWRISINTGGTIVTTKM